MRNLPLFRLFFGFPPLWQGLILAAIGNCVFAHMDVLVKLSGPTEHGFGTLQVVLGRCLFAIPPILLIYFLTPKEQRRIKRPGLHILRLMLGVVAISTTFTAYMVMPIAEAYAIMFASPLLVAVLAIPVLGEKVNWPRLACVGVGFIGVMMIVAARVGGLSLGTWLCIISVISNSAIILVMRVMTRTEATGTILLTFMIGMSLTTIGMLFAVAPLSEWQPTWQWLADMRWQTPDISGWLLLIGIGLAGGVAQLCLIPSYRRLSTPISASFDYSEMLYAVFYGWLIWGTVPGPIVFTGCALVIGGGLAMVRLGRETK